MQLAAAIKAGFTVPQTLVSNDPRQIRQFIDAAHGTNMRVIYKPLSSARFNFAETREVECIDGFERELEIAPVIFQQYVPKGKDLRITIFGDMVVAAEVVSSQPIDWRIDLSHSYRITGLEPQLRRNIIELVAKLQLVTGSIDVRIDPEGCPYFFEVNPSGQFLYMERYGCPNIGEEFVDFLCHDRCA